MTGGVGPESGLPAATLLGLARSLADGSQRLPRTDGARAACVVARQALEQVQLTLLAARGLSCPKASARSRLVCLREAYADRPEVGYRAATAWWRLSSACHHHAYELNPTAGEALALVDDVAWLAQVAAAGPGPTPG